MYDVMVFLPTAKQTERLSTLLTNIRTCLSILELRVLPVVLMTGKYPELESHLLPEELDKTLIIDNATPGKMGNAAQEWAIANLFEAEWAIGIGDDDLLLPWGIPNMWRERDGYALVVGVSIPVTKNGQVLIASQPPIGERLKCGEISGVGMLYHLPSIRRLGPPLWDAQDETADFTLAKNIARNYPIHFVETSVSVLALW